MRPIERHDAARQILRQPKVPGPPGDFIPEIQEAARHASDRAFAGLTRRFDVRINAASHVKANRRRRVNVDLYMDNGHALAGGLAL